MPRNSSNTSVKSEKIFGIGGLPRSGKDTLADALMEHGFYGVSIGDIVRDYARKRHVDADDPISIKNMTETSNWLRSEYGADFALKESLRRFELAQQQKNYKGLVVYSVRAPIEVDFILDKGGVLVWVEASDQVRYERNVQAKRDGEINISKEEFLRQEALQWVPQPDMPKEIQMNLNYVKQRATITLSNEGNDVAAFIKDSLKTLGI